MSSCNWSQEGVDQRREFGPVRRDLSIAATVLAAMLVLGTDSVAEPAAWSPETYACPRTEGVVKVDGSLEEWNHVPWTSQFVDIAIGPAPHLQTRVRMMWDDEYFYVAGEMEEPHLWSTFHERDSIIYFDDDFEVFLDGNDDTHNYAEVEINVFGTVWDLLITEPYREPLASALHTWDIPGLLTAVQVRGTINDPSDVDEGWTVEMAIPWRVLQESAGTDCPPKPGHRWRIAFSRVDWPMEILDQGYVKVQDSEGEDLPASNWVWSRQRQIAMHEPELWGIVEFVDEVRTNPSSGPDGDSASGTQTDRPKILEVDYARWALRQIYYAQRKYFDEQKHYATHWSELIDHVHVPDRGLFATWSWPPTLLADQYGYRASIDGPDGLHLEIHDDGWVGLR